MVISKYVFYKVIYKKRILAHRNCEIVGIKNIITGSGKLEVGMKYVGFSSQNDHSLLRIRGALILKSSYSIGKGCRLDVGPNAKVVLGKGYINPSCKIIITKSLIIGDNTVISWDCTIMDNDFHRISYLTDGGDKTEIDNEKGITIGNDVWIGSGVKILKGASIPNSTIVAAGAIVNKVFIEENTLLGGVPARVIKRGVNWQ